MGDPNLNKAIVKDLEWSPGLNRESSSWESEQATVPRQAWRLRRLWSLEVFAGFEGEFYHIVLPCGVTPHLPLGHTYDLQEGKNKREREKYYSYENRIWQLVPWLTFLPYSYFLSWLRGSSKPKVSSAGVLCSSGPQTLICNRTIQLVASADFSILLPEMQDWWVWGRPRNLHQTC